MADYKISIIIVTYNAAKTLQQCLDSVISQTYSNKEIIVIDSDSKDGTKEILQHNNAAITYWESNDECSIYNAMNKGIKIANGNWLLFLGADDTLCNNIISNVFSVEYATNITMLYGRVNVFPVNKIQGEKTSFEGLVKNNTPHQAVFYHQLIFEKFKGYNEKYKILADYDLNLQIFEHDDSHTLFIDKVVANFSARGISYRTIDYEFFSDKLNFFIQEKGLSKKDSRLANYYFFIGISLILKGNNWKGINNIKKAIFCSNNKLYFLLHSCNFILAQLGYGRKYECV